MSQPPDPDETAPFTHRPYGSDAGDQPFASPSGPSSQPSGPSYVSPSGGPPPPASPPPPLPYGGAGQPAYGYVPVYGAPLPGSLDHKGATTSLVLGIIAVVSLVLTPFCCITLPGLLCAPFAWGIGAKAKNEIDANPTAYGNRGSAQAGFVMGIVGTILAVLMIAVVVVVVVAIGVNDYSLV